MPLRRIILVGILMELCYLSFYAVAAGPEEVLLFIAVNVAAFLLLALLLWRTRRRGEPHGRWILPVLVGFGMLFRLTLVPHGVVGSDDIYRYLWDGKVTAAGTNPYLYVPTDPHLAHLHTPELPAKVNNPELRSVYPAVAQLFFLASHLLFGDSQTGLKLLLVLIDGLTILLLCQVLRARGGSAFPVVLYAWSPLPVLYFGLDGHIDALGIFFLVLALTFLLSGRTIRGAVAIGFGALAKVVPLLIVPFLFRLDKGMRRVWILAAPLLLVGIGSLIFYEPTWGVLDSIRTFGSQWEFNGGIFWLGYILTGSNGAAHLLSAIEIALWVGMITILPRPFLEKVFWGFAGFLLLSPVVHPWYFTWLAALLALRWSLSIFVLLGLSCIANVVVYQYHASGVWRDQPLLLLLEYLPVFILLIREIALRPAQAGNQGPEKSSPTGGPPPERPQ